MILPNIARSSIPALFSSRVEEKAIRAGDAGSKCPLFQRGTNLPPGAPSNLDGLSFL